jgi:hypothetical protein
LPIADTADDPGVLHAEGLAYLSESGFPTNWDRHSDAEVLAYESLSKTSPSSLKPVISAALDEASILKPGRDSLDDYFDSAPVVGLGEPAPVTTLAPLPEKKS